MEDHESHEPVGYYVGMMKESRETLTSLLLSLNKDFWPETVRNGERLQHCLDLILAFTQNPQVDNKEKQAIIEKVQQRCKELVKKLSSLYRTVLQEYLVETLRLTDGTTIIPFATATITTSGSQLDSIDYTNVHHDSIEDDDLDTSTTTREERRVSDGKYRFNEKKYLEENAIVYKSIVKVQRLLQTLMDDSNMYSDQIVEESRLQDIEDLCHGFYHRFTRYLHRCFTGSLSVSHTIGMRIRIDPMQCWHASMESSGFHGSSIGSELLFSDWTEYTNCEEANMKETKRREYIYVNKLRKYFVANTGEVDISEKDIDDAGSSSGLSSLVLSMLTVRGYSPVISLAQLQLQPPPQPSLEQQPNQAISTTTVKKTITAIEKALQQCIHDRHQRSATKRYQVMNEISKRRDRLYVQYGPARDIDEQHWNEYLERKKRIEEEEKKKAKANKDANQPIKPILSVRQRLSKEILQAILQNKPIVLPGNLANLAVGGVDVDSHPIDRYDEPNNKWKQFISLNNLRKLFGNVPIVIAELKENSESKPPFVSKVMLLKKFLFRCQSYVGGKEFASLHYLQQVELDALDEYVDGFSIYDQFGIEPLFPAALCEAIRPEACHHPTLYINMTGGIKTSLHYDRSCTSFSATELERTKGSTMKEDPGKHNLFVQLTGSRTFVLFPPSCTPDMIPFHERHINHISQSTTFLHSVSAHSSDLNEQLKFITESAFPSLVGPWQQRMEITLNAGDSLLIPARWWHYTHLHTPGIALNWWFVSNCLQQRRPINI